MPAVWRVVCAAVGAALSFCPTRPFVPHRPVFLQPRPRGSVSPIVPGLHNRQSSVARSAVALRSVFLRLCLHGLLSPSHIALCPASPISCCHGPVSPQPCFLCPHSPLPRVLERVGTDISCDPALVQETMVAGYKYWLNRFIFIQRIHRFPQPPHPPLPHGGIPTWETP